MSEPTPWTFIFKCELCLTKNECKYGTIQVDYQTKKQYMVAMFKYRSSNLIIFYNYIYSGLLSTIGVIIQNFIELMRNTGFSF